MSSSKPSERLSDSRSPMISGSWSPEAPKDLTETCKKFHIRKLPHLRAAPWCIVSHRRLQMVGCLGFQAAWGEFDGMFIYPFKTQRFAMLALGMSLKREESL